MTRTCLLLAAAAVCASAGHSVWISPVGLPDARYLESRGFDIESFRDSRARIYVDDAGEDMLRVLGYMPMREDCPEPLLPYPSITAINDSLDALVSRHPDICRLETIGYSVQGRPIMAVVVSDNVGAEEVEPELRLVGAIHGDEKTSAMVALTYLQNLADNAATSPMCSHIVTTAETWVIPVMNPDGYAGNTRYNANSVDLNRNLSYMWQPGGGGGSSPFSEVETQALRDVTMKEWPALTGLENPFCASLSLHGGEACFNYVWNYSSASVQDTMLIVQMGADYASLCGIPGFWVTEGWAWYIITGDVNDWSYGEYGGIDHTIEVHSSKQYSDWPWVCAAHYMSMLDFYRQSTFGIWGTVTTSLGAPHDANIQITRTDTPDSQPLRFCRTDVTLGDYAKPLLPGTYQVTASVAGFPPQTVTGVAVGPEQRVEVSFVFDPAGVGGGPEGSLPVSIAASSNPSSGPVDLSCSCGLEGRLSIYDISGRSVFAADIPAGASTTTWDGKASNGAAVPPGVYIARLADGTGAATLRLVRRN